MATVSYSTTSIGNRAKPIDGDQKMAAMAMLADGTPIYVFESDTGEADLFHMVGNSSSDAPSTTSFASTTAGSQRAPDIALLEGGGAVSVWTDASNPNAGPVIRARLFDAAGNPLSTSDFVVGTDPDGEADALQGADVSGLAGGGFVVAYTEADTVNDSNIAFRVFNADGSARTVALYANQSTTRDTKDVQVAGLANGDFVVTWAEKEVLGPKAFSLWTRTFDSQGNALGLARMVDNAGTSNRAPDMVATPDGGYAIAYLDNEYRNNVDVTLAKFDAAGVLTSRIRVNLGTETGQAGNPAITVLPGGFLAVAWQNSSTTSDIAYFDPSGAFLSNPSGSIAGIDVRVASDETGEVFAVSTVTNAETGNDIQLHDERFQRNVVGDATAETLDGTALRDIIEGLGGNDIITGGDGDDRLFGGDGLDEIYGNVGNDLLEGGINADRLFGGQGNDTLRGDKGADTLNGGLGDDSLNGGEGPDTMIGGLGNDSYTVDNAGDVVVEDIDGGIDSVQTTISYTMTANVENIFMGTGTVVGNDLANTMTGGFGMTVFGMGGDDIIEVIGGPVTLDGGTGRDTLTSGFGDDHLIGGNGADILSASEGSDHLTGGLGADTLSGGGSIDFFIYAAINEAGNGAGSRDIITDFQRLGDKIDLSMIDAVQDGGSGNQQFTFLGNTGGAFNPSPGWIRFFHSGGNTIVEGEVNGDGVVDFQIQLTGIIALSAVDFVL